MKKILITPRSFSRYGNQSVQYMQSKGYQVIINQTGAPYSYEEFCKLASDVEGIILGVDIVDKPLLQKAKNLRAISRFGVGIDNIDVEAANQLGIKIARTVGSNSTSVAELTVGFLFMLARNLIDNVNAVKTGLWEKNSGNELCGKTIGLIGLGAIGRKVAAITQGLGMETIGYDPFVDKDDVKQQSNIDVLDFNDVLRKSDYISLHLPLNTNTEGIMNKTSFALMKSSAYLINTARGGLVNEDDLYDALADCKIAGAAADVLATEPPDRNTKLLTLKNFFLSPHIASLTLAAEKNTIDLATKNLLQMLENE